MSTGSEPESDSDFKGEGSGAGVVEVITPPRNRSGCWRLSCFDRCHRRTTNIAELLPKLKVVVERYRLEQLHNDDGVPADAGWALRYRTAQLSGAAAAALCDDLSAIASVTCSLVVNVRADPERSATLHHDQSRSLFAVACLLCVLGVVFLLIARVEQ